MSTSWIAAPPSPETTVAIARVHLRYEDVTQDGRLLLEVLPNALGAAVWSAQLEGDSFAMACIQHGVIPILSRFVVEGTPGPFGVTTPLGVTGRFAGVARRADRVFLNMWAELTGPDRAHVSAASPRTRGRSRPRVASSASTSSRACSRRRASAA